MWESNILHGQSFSRALNLKQPERSHTGKKPLYVRNVVNPSIRLTLIKKHKQERRPTVVRNVVIILLCCWSKEAWKYTPLQTR